MAAPASMIARSLDRCVYSMSANGSLPDRPVAPSLSRARRPRAGGLHTTVPIPSSAQSDSISRSPSRGEQVAVILPGDESRPPVLSLKVQHLLEAIVWALVQMRARSDQ